MIEERGSSSGKKTRGRTATQLFLQHPNQDKSLKMLQKQLKVTFKNPDLLYEALTHKSALTGSYRKLGWYERLEFLGDSVLGLVISTAIWNRFSHYEEGYLSKFRAQLVSEPSIAKKAVLLGLGDCLLLGKSQENTGARHREALLADIFESLLGAIYIDQGLQVVSRVIMSIFDSDIERGYSSHSAGDFKSQLQEKVQQIYKIAPTYCNLSTEGPPHDPIFEVAVLIEDKKIASGVGPSKKKASQEAAKKALKSLDLDRFSAKIKRNHNES